MEIKEWGYKITNIHPFRKTVHCLSKLNTLKT